MSFAEKLKSLRLAKGWSQTELAERAGLTRDGIAHLEQGRRSPSWETAVALADALGVSCEAFKAPPPAAAENQAQPPASAEAPKPGRPRKAPPTGEAPAAAKPARKPGRKGGGR